MEITKRNGRLVLFETGKIVNSILKANKEVVSEIISAQEASAFADDVFDRLTRENEIITTKDVHNSVVSILREHHYSATAEKYKKYQEEKKKAD